ncbi:MAG: hypothetical protein HYV09_32340 [Deltaproteobacteria bacterium]|nr:hypothetical protein [Deltaproteobacteria bacterium]
MRILTCTLSLIACALTAAAVQACVSDQKLGTDGLATTECRADRLPTDGTACDPVKNPAGTFCRLGSCGWGTEAECTCESGRWKCATSSRDDYGCGTPPLCRKKTSTTCDDVCVFRDGNCYPPTGVRTGCCAQPGVGYDEARDCTYGLEQTIGCAPDPIPLAEACGMTGAVGCAITMEGTKRRVWFTPGRTMGWTGSEACSSELYERVVNAKPCPGDAGVDAVSDADAGPDSAATTYVADDFDSWRWSWVGTGMFGSFAMDRDCGIDAEGTLSYYGGPPTGAGVVAADECAAFKALAVSSEVTSAFAKFGGSGAWCAPVSDDYTTAKLTVRDGGTHGVTWAGGCSDVEPFKKLRTEMTRLGGKYIVPATTDAATDGG